MIGEVDFFNLKLSKAYVTNCVDPDEEGKIQVRPIPEGTGWRESFLPWAKPFFHVDKLSQSYTSYEKGTLVWILYSHAYKEVYILKPRYLKGLIDHSIVKSQIESIDELVGYTEDFVTFRYLPGGMLLYHNHDNGESAVIFNTGASIIHDENGQLVAYTNAWHIVAGADDLLSIEGGSSIIEVKTDGTLKFEGEGTIEVKSGGQVDINGGALTVDK